MTDKSLERMVEKGELATDSQREAPDDLKMGHPVDLELDLCSKPAIGEGLKPHTVWSIRTPWLEEFLMLLV